jgi:predicted AAA+ superfamily ATPase
VSVSKILKNIVYNELVSRGYKVYVGKLDTVVSLDNFANRNDEGIIGISLKDFLLKETF